jgi:hypothetical protein
VPDTEPLPDPLFFGPNGPLSDDQGPRIAQFTDCPDGPNCREARRKGVEAAMLLEREGKGYETQRIVAEAIFLTNLIDKPHEGDRRGAAFPAVQESVRLISELAAQGGKSAKIAERLEEALLRAEFRSRRIRVGM